MDIKGYLQQKIKLSEIYENYTLILSYLAELKGDSELYPTKRKDLRGAWLAQSEGDVTSDLRVLSLKPMLGLEIT